MRSGWLFLSLFSVLAMPGRFTPIFYSAHELSDTQIGFLMATRLLVSLGAGPLLCNIADRTGRRELVCALSYMAAMACFLAQLVALPALGLLSPAVRFPYLLFFRALYGFFSAPAYPLVSAIAVAQLREVHGDRGHRQFGAERVWGTISWALCAFGLGAVLDLPGVGVWVVYVGVLVFGSGFVVSLLVFERTERAKKMRSYRASEELADGNLLGAEDGTAVSRDAFDVADDTAGSRDDIKGENETADETKSQKGLVVSISAFHAYRRILTEGGPATVMFFNLLFWLYGGMSLVENLLFLFFQDDLHASNLLCGISVVVTTLFEVPLFARAPELLQYFGSARLAILGSLGFVVRGFGYGVAPNGWFALLVEPLHGVTYAAIATVAVSFVAERTPTELEATGQSLLDVIHTISFTIGSAGGGYIMQTYGSKALYQGAAFLVLLATVVFTTVNTCYGDQNSDTVEREEYNCSTEREPMSITSSPGENVAKS